MVLRHGVHKRVACFRVLDEQAPDADRQRPEPTGRRQHGNEENEHSVVGPFPLARVIVAAGADAGLLRGVVETNGYRIAPQVLH